MKRVLMAATAIGFLILALGAPSASAPVPHQLDTLIAKGPGPFIGNGIYSDDGKGETLSLKSRPGSMKTFPLEVQNEGALPDVILGSGCDSAGKFIVSYDADGTDVTGQMAGGSFSSTLISAGGSYSDLVLSIKAKSSAHSGAKLLCLITMSSAGAKGGGADSVAAKVTIR